MEASRAAILFVFLGVAAGLAGFFSGGFFWGSLLYVGVSWFVAGIAYAFAGKEITEGGIFAAFLLGALGALLWLVIDMRRGASGYESRGSGYGTSFYNPGGENYKCRYCRWFGHDRCRRREDLINAIPCEDFLLRGSRRDFSQELYSS